MASAAALEVVLRCAAAVALLASVAWISYLLSRRLLPGATASVRACGAVGIAYWLLVAVFSGLVSLGLFRLEFAIPLWGVGAAVAHRALGAGEAWQQARADAARLRQVLAAAWRSWLRWPLLGLAVVAVPPILRSLVAPPLAWDALTYHLVKAARWVQTGGWAPSAGPDAWGYYNYYPHGGDIIWAWAMLVDHGDAFLGPTALLVWLSLQLGAYGSARALGANTERSLAVALAIGTTPVIFRFLTALLVDDTVVAVLLLALPLARRIAESARPADSILLLCAVGVATSIKEPALALIPLTLAWVAFETLRRRNGVRAAAFVCIAGAAAAVVGLPSYLRAWWETGSPLYPLPLVIGGRQILAGNNQLTLLMTRSGPPGQSYWPRMIHGLFFGDRLGMLGFGPAGPLVLALGAAGQWTLARKPVERAFGALVLVWAGVLALPVLSERGLWIPVWAAVSVRLLGASYSLLVVCGALVRGRLADAIWMTTITAGLAFGWPQGIGAVDARALAELGGLGLGAAALGALVWAGGRAWWRRRGALLAGGLVTLALFAVAWHGVRAKYRDLLFEAAADGESYDVHPSSYTVAWPIWRQLDAGPPRRIAVVAGWATSGHNAYLYPLFGSRLQNVVLYVSPARDGSPLDYGLAGDPWQRAGQAEEWFERLAAQHVDVVVTLMPPPPVETSWIRTYPERFERILCTRDEQSCAWQFSASPRDRQREGPGRRGAELPR